MQQNTDPKAEHAEQLEALGFSSEADYAEHQRVIANMRNLTLQQLTATRAAGGLDLVHLSETGLHAGRRLCLAPRDQSGRSVHAVFAPLQNETFRDQVCPKCLEVWAVEAYEDGDTMPEYIAAIRTRVELDAAAPAESNDTGGGA